MSLVSSNLGTSVDFVVATTLDAINANMYEYLSADDLPVVSFCWLQNTPGGPLIPISLQDLMNPGTSGGTNGTNPFNVSSWTNSDPVTSDITNLENSNFFCGIQMQLGLPGGMAAPGAPNPNNFPLLPYVLMLSATNTNTAIFTLLCAQFQVAYSAWGSHGVFTYTNESQPSGTAWGITLNVPLTSIEAGPNTAIPADVTAQLDNLGPDLFSIQQLFLDFSSAVFTTVPTFTSSFPPDVTNQITPAMIQTFMAENEKNGGLAVLGFSITQDSPNVEPSSLNVGSMSMVFDEYNPYVPTDPSAMLSTLNYLCNQGSTPPPQNYSGISWNWIDSGGDGAQYDGAVAISSAVFIPYLANLLAPIVAKYSNKPNISCWYDGLTMYLKYYLSQDTPPAYTAGTGGNIINFSYNSGTVEADCGDKILLTYYQYKSSVSYSLSVTVSGNTLTIVQNYVIYAYVEYESSATDWGGNYVDTTCTDVYQMSADQNGNLLFSDPVQTTSSNGQVPPSNKGADFFLGIDQLENYINSQIQLVPTDLQGIPAATIGKFVFPGGQTFAFAEPQFATSNDLVAYLTYLIPTEE